MKRGISDREIVDPSQATGEHRAAKRRRTTRQKFIEKNEIIQNLDTLKKAIEIHDDLCRMVNEQYAHSIVMHLFALASLSGIIVDPNCKLILDSLHIFTPALIRLHVYMAQSLFDYMFKKMFNLSSSQLLGYAITLIARNDDPTTLNSLYEVLREKLDLNNKNITNIEFIHLVKSFLDYSKKDKCFEPTIEAHYKDFLKFLIGNCSIEQLLTLVKLGANKKDCQIDLFEKADAREAINNDRKTAIPDPHQSLLWLAAKAVNKHQDTIKIPQNLNGDLLNLLETSKKYAI